MTLTPNGTNQYWKLSTYTTYNLTSIQNKMIRGLSCQSFQLKVQLITLNTLTIETKIGLSYFVVDDLPKN